MFRLGVLGVLVLVVTGCGTNLAGEPEIMTTSAPHNETVNMVVEQSGVQLFEENCVRCHAIGAVGSENAPAIDLTLSESEMAAVIENGRGVMPAFVNQLSEEQRGEIIAYLQTLAPVTADVANSEVVLDTDPVLETVVEVPARGTITNATEGAGLPEDLIATLHIVDQNMDERTREVTVGPDGTFLFEAVPVQEHWHYFVTVFYERGFFTSDMFVGDPTVTEISLPVALVELTDDPSVIQIRDVITQLEPAVGGVQILQIVNFQNTSDRMFIVGEENTVQTSVGIPIPDGAQVLDMPQSANRFVPQDDFVMDTHPVFPQEDHVVHVSFLVPYGESIDLTQAFGYPVTGQVEVLAANPITVRSDLFTEAIAEPAGDLIFNRYSAESVTLAAEQSLSLNIAAPASIEPTGNARIGDVANALAAPGPREDLSVLADSRLRWVFAIIGGLLVLVGVLLFLREWLSPLPDDLVKQIAELDTRYQTGKIAQDAYESQRGHLKARLARQLQQSTTI